MDMDEVLRAQQLYERHADLSEALVNTRMLLWHELTPLDREVWLTLAREFLPDSNGESLADLDAGQ